MIICVKYENLHQFGKAFHSQFCLRHQCFIERQNYAVSNIRGMEFDQYDTPAAVYLVYLSPEGEAWGCSRLTPVTHGSMLKDLWPDLVDEPGRVFQPNVWEGTRFCIKKELPVLLRRRISRELVLGYLEAGLEIGMSKIIGVMPPLIFKKVFIDPGCEYEILGPQKKISSGEIITAASISVSANALSNIQKATGIYDPVISMPDMEVDRTRRVA